VKPNVPGMHARLSRLVAQHPARTLAVLAAIASLGFVATAAGLDNFVLGGGGKGSEKLLIQTSGREPARSPAYQVVLRTMRSQLSTNPAVHSLGLHYVAGQPRSAVLVVGFGDAGAGEREDAVGRIEADLDPGPLLVSYSGQSALLRAAREAIVHDLDLLLLALPLVLLLLVAALGPRPAAAVVLAVAATIGLASALCVALALVVDVSALALVGAGGSGLLTASQLCLLARRGADPAALGAASRAGAVVHLGLCLLGVSFLAWLGFGGAVAALLAYPVALAAMDATTSLWGPAGQGQPTAERALRRLERPLRRWAAVAGAAVLVSAGILVVAALPLHELDLVTLAAQPPEIDGLRLGLAVATAIAAVVAIGWVACRRPLLALGSGLAAGLPAAAATGLLVLVFQDGRFQDFLGYSPAGGLFLGALAGSAALVASACAARWTALLGSVRQLPRLAFHTVRGPVDGPAAALPALLTTLIGGATGVALVFSSLIYLKQFGLGVALGLALDFLAVRLLLAPALLRLLGPRK